MKRLLAALVCLLLLVPASAGAETVPAQAAYLVEANSGTVLFEQNAHAHLPMASTTKIMTALLAIESGRMQETVTVAPEAAGTEGSSMYLKAGERLPLADLVYGLMLRSGNDAAAAIACFLDGGIAAFADRMNARAEELKLKDTHFTNPNGLHDPDHYTSAHDLCMLAAAALDNPTFCEIVRTQYYESRGDTVRTLKNKNRLLWEYEGAIGVKTGYTKAAGKCLAFAAERGGMKLVGVVLNCPSMWDTAESMLEGAFSTYRARLFLGTDAVFMLPVQNGSKKTLPAAPISCILVPVRRDDDAIYSVETTFLPTVCAPVAAGDAVGTATLYRNGEAIRSVPIVAREAVDARGFTDYFEQAVSSFVHGIARGLCGCKNTWRIAAWLRAAHRNN